MIFFVLLVNSVLLSPRTYHWIFKIKKSTVQFFSMGHVNKIFKSNDFRMLFFLLLHQTFQHHSRHMILLSSLLFSSSISFFFCRAITPMFMLTGFTLHLYQISSIKLVLASDKNPRLFNTKIIYTHSWCYSCYWFYSLIQPSCILTHKINFVAYFKQFTSLTIDLYYRFVIRVIVWKDHFAIESMVLFSILWWKWVILCFRIHKCINWLRFRFRFSNQNQTHKFHWM